MLVKLASAVTLAMLSITLAGIAQAEDKGGRLEEAFKTADKDNDGTLTREEAKAMPRVSRNFDAIDTNKDGTVSLEEVRGKAKQAAEAAHDRAADKFKAADKDHSGTLTREEAKAMPRVAKNFDAIDGDKDGTVSPQEIHDYMKARHDQRK